MAGQKFQRFGRGGGRAQRAQSRSGGPWPPLLLWFCGPSGPAKRRRPGGHPCGILLPPGQQASVGRTAVARGRRMDGAVTGGGGVWRPWGGPQGRPTAAKQKRGTRGQRPRAPLFQGASRPAAAPPGRYDLHQGQKRQQNAQPYGRPNPAPPHWSHDGMRSAPVKELYRGRADEARGDEGSGGTARFAAGGDPKIPLPAIGRISPCA